MPQERISNRNHVHPRRVVTRERVNPRIPSMLEIRPGITSGNDIFVSLRRRRKWWSKMSDDVKGRITTLDTNVMTEKRTGTSRPRNSKSGLTGSKTTRRNGKRFAQEDACLLTCHIAHRTHQHRCWVHMKGTGSRRSCEVSRRRIYCRFRSFWPLLWEWTGEEAYTWEGDRWRPIQH